MARPDIVAEINSFNTWTPSQLVEAFEGSTRRAAEALGVTQRSVQRYLQGTRNPSKAVGMRMGAAGRKAQGDTQIGATFAGNILIGSQPREREVNRVYDAEQWDELSDMAAKGDAEGCWQFVADEYQVSDFHVLDGEILIGEE